MVKNLSLILLLFLLTGCMAREIDFDVFDNKGAKSPLDSK